MVGGWPECQVVAKPKHRFWSGFASGGRAEAGGTRLMPKPHVHVAIHGPILSANKK